jgi:hypothetical protein
MRIAHRLDAQTAIHSNVRLHRWLESEPRLSLPSDGEAVHAFDKPGPYLQALEKLHRMVVRVDMKRMFVDGSDVCLRYDLVTNTSAGTSSFASGCR